MAKTSDNQKLYCYVDETGQDTQGRLFIVCAAFLSGNDQRDAAIQICKSIEHATGKGRRKWIKSRPRQRLAYIRRILEEPLLQGSLYFSVYAETVDYLALTSETIALATKAHAQGQYKVTVLFDGLPKSLSRTVGKQLRDQEIRVRRVRGVNEENDALSRLADAVCGFVRAGMAGQKDYANLFQEAQRRGYLTQVKKA